jgi:hypothetical protein
MDNKNKRYRDSHKEELAEKQRLRRLQQRLADPEAARARDRARYAADPRLRERRRQSYKRFKLSDPVRYERAQAHNRMVVHFKRTLEEYEELLELQNGRCLICKKTEEENGRRLAWDHDHLCCPGKKSCGKCVRGLLCTSCNLAVGRLELGSYAAHIDYILEWHDGQS